MSVNEGFLLVVRWLHALSAVSWIGGSIFFWLILRPAVRKSGDSSEAVSRIATLEFRGLVDTCILVLVVTGSILTFDRLTAGFISTPYVGALGVKITVALVMFHLARSGRRRTSTISLPSEGASNSFAAWRKVTQVVSGYNAIVILGVLVVLLADLLKVLFERALAGN